jgi:hypothetical protein
VEEGAAVDEKFWPYVVADAASEMPRLQRIPHPAAHFQESQNWKTVDRDWNCCRQTKVLTGIKSSTFSNAHKNRILIS